MKSGGRGLEGNVADFYTADAESGAPAGMQAAAVVCALLELSAVTPVPYQKLQHTHTHTHTHDPAPSRKLYAVRQQKIPASLCDTFF